jgi:hypothetical protein
MRNDYDFCNDKLPEDESPDRDASGVYVNEE